MSSPKYPQCEIHINPLMDAADIALEAVQELMDKRLPAKQIDEYKRQVIRKQRNEVLEVTRKWMKVKGAAYV